ncbi:hypothetical protein F2Q68_00004322 [Brassica cretica]|uniref:Uncharacterized protein n=1 Tax=Brassica cretica TaxID=69181 RepID=A0A8S9JLR6_BRACR|nr:hypothetical protein F2Q68_00004322 [Brassica cretica]
MEWGGRGVFIGCINQSDSSRVAAPVSLHMAPNACAATPRAPHVRLHDQDVMQGDTMPTPSTCLMQGLVACTSTPQRPNVDQHALVAG